MNLYHITHVLWNYTMSGYVLVKAKTLDECREYFRREFVDNDASNEDDVFYRMSDFNLAISDGQYTVFSLTEDDPSNPGIIAYAFGVRC